uniref:Uncharacterized protein n=1 Tax=Psilocybe cubensis TaxID=181762 RepID=A0A8H7XVX1_PSICU
MNVNSGTARVKKTAMGNPPTPGQNDTASADRTTRSKGTVVNEDLQQIQNAKGGRAILEEHQLLVPAGQGLTTHRAAACLFQIAQMSNKTPPIVIQAMRGLAFMLKDMEIPMATQTYHDGFGEELATFTNEIKALVQHAQDKVDQKLDEINKATSNLIKSASAVTPQQPSGNGPSYSQALSKGLSIVNQILVQANMATNPRMLARHGIRARQTMLEGINKEAKISSMGDKEAKDAVNKILQSLEPEGSVRIRSAIKQRNGGLLIEFDSDFGAAWMRVEENRNNLCKRIGDDVTTKKRTYELIALGVPITAEPKDAVRATL